MAITRANTAKAEPLNSVGTSFATGAFAATNGNAIVVFIRSGGAGGSLNVTSVTDTAGNTYTQRVTNFDRDPSMWVYVAKNITGHATNVVTVNISGTTSYTWAFAVEYAGVDADPEDVYPSNDDTAATDLVTNSITTNFHEEVVVLGGSQDTLSTFTAGTDFTLIDGAIGNVTLGGTFGGVEEYITGSALGGYTGHMTSDTSAQYCIVGVTLKQAGATPVVSGSGGGGTMALMGV